MLASMSRIARLPSSIVLPVTGLTYPSNDVAGSDVALDWTGAAMVPRFSHSVLWKAKYIQQTGYYAFGWHCLADNSWDFGLSGWEYGTHPFPTDGRHDGAGYSTGGTGSSGTVHYHEIANGSDKISDGGSPLILTTGVETWALRTSETVGSDYVNKFYPDLKNNASFFITWTQTIASVAPDPGIKFRLGCSPWTASGGTNSETSSGSYWHLLQYTRALSAAEALVKFALTNNDTTDPDRHYSNISPTPTDVTDKSGKGNNPSWPNANRPSLYTP